MRTTLRPALLLGLALQLPAQTLTLPPDGGNMKASVTQAIGPVTVSVSYSSPRVHLAGQDRTGRIWGELVPYGMSDLGFNGCTSCPWRAGANENTVFTVSHPIKVEGRPLPAGSYGLHMVPGKETFTVIFSRHAGAWGSYFYDPKEDALRVEVKPAKAEFHEWLSYEFTEREPARATLALFWENLKVPVALAVEDPDEIYFQTLVRELRGGMGFNWVHLSNAAQFTLKTGKHLEEGLAWARRAVEAPYIGQENFQTLSTVGLLELALGRAEQAARTFEKAIAGGAPRPVDGHQLGRQLLQQGRKAEALRIFEANARRFPNQWPVHVGLARGHAANGNLKKALEHARLGLAQAPDELNRKSLAGMVEQLEKGQAPK